MRKLVVGILLLLLVTGLALGQELAGTITGTVKDQQGAVIPGASVTATHGATNFVYRATTSRTGRFTIPQARLGQYTVVVEAQGFSRSIVQRVSVQVGGTADLNVEMTVGSLVQEVTVTADTAQEIIRTTDAELGTVVDQRQVLELPLNGRNAAELTFLQAGTFYEKSSTGQGNKLLIHGQRHRATAFTLDGIDTQDNLNRASSVMVDQPILALTSENVQEFRVVTGLSSAEFSRGGSQVTAVTRAGTNNYHGSVFWFHRNDFFGANEFFNNASNVPRPKRLRNQFGGRVGGPIWKDKAFFFFGYQQTRDVRGIPVNRTVYTPEARNGIFRFLDNVLNTPENVANNPGLVRQINMMECSATVMSILGRPCVDSRFNSASPATFDPFIWGTIFNNSSPDEGIPLPNNFDIGDGLNTGGYRFNSKSNTYEHLPAFRFDYRITDKHLFYGTINGVDRNIEGDFINGRETRYPAFGPLGERLTNSYGFSGAVISTFSANFVNEFRVGRAGGENAFGRLQPFGTEFTLDLNDVTDPYEPGGGLSVRDNVTLHIRDSMTWVKGSHHWKFGGEWRHRSVNNISLFGTAAFGEIDFNTGDNPPGFDEAELRRLARNSSGMLTPVTDIETSDFNNSRDQMNNYVGAVGNVEARFNVLGPNDGFGPLGTPERRIFRDREIDLFVQDNWSLLPNLSLNLGLRWEFVTVPIETQGLSLVPDGGADAVFGISGQSGFFNPGTFDGVVGCTQLGQVPITITSANATPTALQFINDCAVKNILGGSNNGRPFYDNDYNNFGPVIGVAWDPWGNGKTSVRAGFRISYIQDVFSIMDGNLDDNEGLTVDNTCVPADGTCVFNSTAPFLLRNMTSAPVSPQPVFILPVARTFVNGSDSQDFRTYANDLATSYYREWTFGIQHELFRNWAVDIRYVGNQGLKLRRIADFNEMNILARDSVSGQTFLESFLIAQQNLACQGGGRFDDVATTACPNPTPNPLMRALIATDAARLRADTAMVTALLQNEVGDFIDDYLTDTTSRVHASSATSQRIRGGAFWGAVLTGRLPANFFQANPFVASSRRMENDGFSDYHAMELEVRRRSVGGFAFQANYTYQKALADYDGDANELLNDVRPSSVINTKYTKGEIVPRHQFSANWVYELPFGKGKRVALEGFRDRMFGGWQFGGIVQWRSGRPDSIFSGVGTFHRSAVSGANRVNLATPASKSLITSLTGRKTPPTGGVFWLDPCLSIILNPSASSANCFDPHAAAFAGLFTLPNPGELGTIPGQGIIVGPRFFNFDFNLVKRTKVTESTDVEFRWEVFNAFNNVNFSLPNTDIFSPSFGQILSTVGDRRLMQFALKFNF